MYILADNNYQETYDSLDEVIDAVQSWYDHVDDLDLPHIPPMNDIIEWDGKYDIDDVNRYIKEIEELIALHNGYEQWAGHGNYVVSAASKMGLNLSISRG